MSTHQIPSISPSSGLLFLQVHDLRFTGGILPVRDQGESGSCYAFAVLKAVEYLYYHFTKRQSQKPTGGDRLELSLQDLHQNTVKSVKEDNRGKFGFYLLGTTWVYQQGVV
ncbi:hypothetical protein P8452_58644 [Trifolium repens]|nr:hypothetical protein P8452_58644 [Trifolium repens]